MHPNRKPALALAIGTLLKLDWAKALNASPKNRETFLNATKLHISHQAADDACRNLGPRRYVIGLSTNMHSHINGYYLETPTLKFSSLSAPLTIISRTERLEVCEDFNGVWYINGDPAAKVMGVALSILGLLKTTKASFDGRIHSLAEFSGFCETHGPLGTVIIPTSITC